MSFYIIEIDGLFLQALPEQEGTLLSTSSDALSAIRYSSEADAIRAVNSLRNNYYEGYYPPMRIAELNLTFIREWVEEVDLKPCHCGGAVHFEEEHGQLYFLCSLCKLRMHYEDLRILTNIDTPNKIQKDKKIMAKRWNLHMGSANEPRPKKVTHSKGDY